MYVIHTSFNVVVTMATMAHVCCLLVSKADDLVRDLVLNDVCL